MTAGTRIHKLYRLAKDTITYQSAAVNYTGFLNVNEFEVNNTKLNQGNVDQKVAATSLTKGC